MKTSNYTTAGKDPGAIAISAMPPWWFRGPIYPALAPPLELLSAYLDGDVTPAWYAARYAAARLDLLEPVRVAEDLLELVAPHEPVLLCWCGREKFCHRHLVARWLAAAGIPCEEI